jgi:hypothetical protein
MPELGQVNGSVKQLHDEGVMKGSVLLLLLLLVPSPSPSKRRPKKVWFFALITSRESGIPNPSLHVLENFTILVPYPALFSL